MLMIAVQLGWTKRFLVLMLQIRLQLTSLAGSLPKVLLSLTDCKGTAAQRQPGVKIRMLTLHGPMPAGWPQGRRSHRYAVETAFASSHNAAKAKLQSVCTTGKIWELKMHAGVW